MSRAMETLLRRAFRILAAAFGAGALALFLQLLLAPPPPASMGLGHPAPRRAGAGPSTGRRAAKRKLEKLAHVQMTQRIVALRPPERRAPPPPDLARLIRVKGILDFGDPRNNEAIVEILRTRKTGSYRIGDTLKGVQAVVLKIGAAVTFRYAGKTVTLRIRGEDQSGAQNLASPDGNVRMATRPEGDRTP